MWNKIVESNDPDEFVTLIRPADRKLLVTERGQFAARATLIDIGGLQVQRRYERLPRIMHIEATRPGIIFLTEPGPEMFLNGAPIRYGDIALFNSGEAYLWRLSGPTDWGAMTLADDDMKAVWAPHPAPARRSTQISGFAVVTPPAGALARLRMLHASAGSLATTFREPAKQNEFAPAFEQALTMAMVRGMSTGEVHSDTTARQHHEMTIRRFVEVLEAQPLEPFRMQTTCVAIGVSDRTLRVACQEQFGVSPAQYVMLRRMRSARRALRKANPETMRVTDIATEHGFWELGRFAVNYRHIFGDSPSATLRETAAR
jgi:methylphosphotriester-DNA--protein-cysteine methyltransferase